MSEDSAALLTAGEYDVVFVIADGLSALAVERHALHLLRAVLPLIAGWRLAPVCVVEQGRVAVGDAIGEALHAPLAVMLIGECPGLSSPDSLGVYITWEPRRGREDAERNCISNIREEGLGYAAAASRLHYYMQEAARRNDWIGAEGSGGGSCRAVVGLVAPKRNRRWNRVCVNIREGKVRRSPHFFLRSGSR